MQLVQKFFLSPGDLLLGLNRGRALYPLSRVTPFTILFTHHVSHRTINNRLINRIALELGRRSYMVGL